MYTTNQKQSLLNSTQLATNGYIGKHVLKAYKGNTSIH